MAEIFKNYTAIPVTYEEFTRHIFNVNLRAILNS